MRQLVKEVDSKANSNMIETFIREKAAVLKEKFGIGEPSARSRVSVRSVI